MERAVLACAMVHPELVRDAVEAGQWRPDLWNDHHCRKTAQAILDLVVDEVETTMVNVYKGLLGTGVPGGPVDMAARDAVLLAGAGESIDHRYVMLQHWLGELADMASRTFLRRRIISLADQLDRPGGIRRVAAALGEVA